MARLIFPFREIREIRFNPAEAMDCLSNGTPVLDRILTSGSKKLTSKHSEHGTDNILGQIRRVSGAPQSCLSTPRSIPRVRPKTDDGEVRSRGCKSPVRPSSSLDWWLGRFICCSFLLEFYRQCRRYDVRNPCIR